MSCDWDVHCITCNDSHGFFGANHCDRLMWELCKAAKALGTLGGVHREAYEIRIGSYGSIRPAWFAEHAEHELAPIDEYGRVDNQCDAVIKCEHCGNSDKRCGRQRNHEGEHGPKIETPKPPIRDVGFGSAPSDDEKRPTDAEIIAARAIVRRVAVFGETSVPTARKLSKE